MAFPKHHLVTQERRFRPTVGWMTTNEHETNDTQWHSPPNESEGPQVQLGHMEPNGISPSIYGLVELGKLRRPELARQMRGRVELRFREDLAPVRLSFGDERVLIEDADEQNGWQPELLITGSLPEIVQLTAAPLFAGVPKLTNARGRAALANLAGGKVKIEGSAVLARRLLKLLEI